MAPTRTMWTVTVCLVTTSVFAADYDDYLMQPLPVSEDYGVSTFPIDYNDDIFNILKINKTNLIYNFEQIRMDQPPHVEKRIESIGKYLYRRPQFTTTTTIAPRLDGVSQDFQSLPRLPTFNPVNNYNQHQWIPPPPPTLEWVDLPAILSQQTPSDNPPQLPHETFETPDNQLQSNYLTQYQTPSSVQSTSITQREKAQEINEKRNLQSYSTTQKSQSYDNPPKTVSKTYLPMNYQVKRKPGQNLALSEAPQVQASRGSRKFGLKDVATPIPSITTTTYRSVKIAPQNSNMPPPVPTLTPWLDGFRK